MKYHAHIYWKDSKEREVALAMRPSLRLMGCKMGRIWDNPIGPHPI
ncbi:MAG: DOPA 4,5-dioxygenase family protein, partial [Alphaproteobacteria bacterium]